MPLSDHSTEVVPWPTPVVLCPTRVPRLTVLPVVEKYGALPVRTRYSVHDADVWPTVSVLRAWVVHANLEVAPNESAKPLAGQTENDIHVVSLAPPAAIGVCASPSRLELNHAVSEASESEYWRF